VDSKKPSELNDLGIVGEKRQFSGLQMKNDSKSVVKNTQYKIIKLRHYKDQSERQFYILSDDQVGLSVSE